MERIVYFLFLNSLINMLTVSQSSDLFCQQFLHNLMCHILFTGYDYYLALFIIADGFLDSGFYILEQYLEVISKLSFMLEKKLFEW